MTTENKQIFTRRIANANRTQLVVISYEILLVYLEDAKREYEEDNRQEFERSIGLARECIGQLRASLNFEYEPSKSLFSIYCFADRELAKDIFARKTDNLAALISIFTKLHDAFDAISAEDTSEPLMENTQDVYAGFTYGRNDLNESLANYDAARGYMI